MSEAKPLFIVFEGLDGSGKTTAAKAIAKALGAKYLTTPSLQVREYRDVLVESLGLSQEARQLFYLATVFAASVEARQLLASAHTVVLDRYFLSTQAYAEFRGSRLQLDGIQDQLFPAHLTVFLDAVLNVRQSRLSSRGISAADRETLTEEADAKLRATHLSRAALPVLGSFLRIDTSDRSIVDVVDIVLQEVYRLR